MLLINAVRTINNAALNDKITSFQNDYHTSFMVLLLRTPFEIKCHFMREPRHCILFIYLSSYCDGKINQ